MANERPIHLDTDDARAGATPGVMRYVLGISLAIAIAVMVILLLIYR